VPWIRALPEPLRQQEGGAILEVGAQRGGEQRVVEDLALGVAASHFDNASWIGSIDIAAAA
jgi:hypothetical protein